MMCFESSFNNEGKTERRDDLFLQSSLFLCCFFIVCSVRCGCFRFFYTVC